MATQLRRESAPPSCCERPGRLVVKRRAREQEFEGEQGDYESEQDEDNTEDSPRKSTRANRVLG